MNVRRSCPPVKMLVPFLIALQTTLLALLLLIGCTASSPARRGATPASTHPAAHAIPATPALSPGVVTHIPSVTTPLAAPPHDCPLKDPPQKMHLPQDWGNLNTQVDGGGTFWLLDVFYSRVQHLGPSTSDPGYPMTKWVVEVGPHAALPVTLRLRQLATGELAWWTDGNTPPRAATQTLILDPLPDTHDVGSVPGMPAVPHGSPASGWYEWGIFPVFRVAGCYALDASWDGGSWESIMAVGQ